MVRITVTKTPASRRKEAAINACQDSFIAGNSVDFLIHEYTQLDAAPGGIGSIGDNGCSCHGGPSSDTSVTVTVYLKSTTQVRVTCLLSQSPMM